MSYHHTQFGWVTLGTTVVMLPLVAVGLWSSHPATLLLVIMIVALICLLFGWLTVDVDDRRLLMTMGIGLIRRNIPLSMVRAFAPVINRCGIGVITVVCVAWMLYVYSLDQWGRGKLFINRNSPPYVVVGFADGTKTRDLYGQLSQNP